MFLLFNFKWTEWIGYCLTINNKKLKCDNKMKKKLISYICLKLFFFKNKYSYAQFNFTWIMYCVTIKI